MKIEYQKYDFKIKFEKPISIEIYPPYILRSLLGMHLKKLSCIFKNLSSCKNCPVNKQCAYSFIFESIEDKDNSVLRGRERVSHPFIIISHPKLQNRLDSLEFQLTLFGRSIQYFPYIFQAFSMAGEGGIFKERVKFKIEQIRSGSKLLYRFNEENLSLGESEVWQIDLDRETKSAKKLELSFNSPFRYQKNNRVSSDFNYSDILISSFRRANILSSLYGENSEDIEKVIFESFNEDKKILVDTRYRSMSRYSARQGKKMTIGGVMGKAIVEGDLSPFELSILYGGSIFNIGKNVSMGFGAMKLEEI